MKYSKALLNLLFFFILLNTGMVWAFDDIDITIVDDNGRAFAMYPASSRHGNRHRAYLEAERDAAYNIRIYNRSQRRIGLVVAVDGRNIISGRHSNLSRRERMYVLNAGEEASYSGWRTGRNRVNRFYFTDAADSYADTWNDTADIGIIAVAVYPERQRRRDGHKYRSQKWRQHTPSPEAGAGTGFGEEEYSPSRKVKFRAQKHASSRHFIQYEWRRSLCRKGIIHCRPHSRRHFRERDNGFAQPPPGYR